MIAAPILLYVAGALAVVAATWLILHQRHIVFKPSSELLGDPATLGFLYEDVFPLLSNAVRVHGWWLPCPGSRKLILYFAGSIGNISHELNTIAFLRDLGLNVLIIDYPGFGRSEGGPRRTAATSRRRRHGSWRRVRAWRPKT